MKEWTLKEDTLVLVNHYHAEQRYNGEPYVQAHLIPVAQKAKELAEVFKFSQQEILKAEILGLLHDILEDTDLSEQELEAHYGAEMLSLCKALCNKHSTGEKKSKDEYYAEIARYPLAKIVKTADRIINISRLKFLKDSEKQQKLMQKYLQELVFYQKYGIYSELIEAELGA